MQLSIKQALNKAYLKSSITDTQLSNLVDGLNTLLSHINESESEEFHKNLISTFLNDTFYKGVNFINTKGNCDLVIHNGIDAKSSVGVLLEAKSPSNKAEMLKVDNINCKALQEMVLYYLRERITANNIEIKHLIATNLYEWFVFDANVFERHFAQNKQLVKKFKDFEEGKLSGTNTSLFYDEIAKPYINTIASNIEFTYINLKELVPSLKEGITRNSKAAKNVANLYKFLSPQHLFKQSISNDSNSLNREFYNELLYILGLEQASEGNKKIIRRCDIKTRQRASLVENTITQLDSHDRISRLAKPSSFGEGYQEQLFNVTLELIITWVNRVLFLKLLESQLVNYHKGNKEYRFLNFDKIKDFDDLDKLFFRVLARKIAERDEDINLIFSKVPYLNSSLFEPTDLEHQTLFINGLEDFKQLPIYTGTVLKDTSGKRRTGNLSTLEYLFEFLDAYNFASEGSDEIREDSKALISASVLGLIFEKINGYKDGSFFTPAFITMYMCRETVRRSVVQKFNEVKGWSCSNFVDLYNKIDDNKEANDIVNSIKICDPAVGSGHFLVSALNEIIAIKSDLRILADREGRLLKEYSIEVVNDELIVADSDGDIFDYNPKLKESQRVQEALFHEKQTIIENCLFGVDINPNSVKICRLRLWIELLKNAYYKASNLTELETLPNIDINIKCGNSLVSRYALDVDIKKALKSSRWTIDNYRTAVMSYRNATSKEQKRDFERLIESIKGDFETEVKSNDKRLATLNKLRGELFSLTKQTSIFERTKAEIAKWNKEVDKAAANIKKLEAELEEIRNNKVYENAFEWRFEFPEVLNDEGDFIGFDAVIGNPPYIRQEEIKDLKPYLQEEYSVYAGTSDLYVFFVERGFEVLRRNGFFSFIMPSKWMQAGYGKPLREFLCKKGMQEIVDFGDLQIFDGATTYPCIVTIQNNKASESVNAAMIKTLQFGSSFNDYVKGVINEIPLKSLGSETWVISSTADRILLSRMNEHFQNLQQYVGGDAYRGILTGLTEAFVVDREYSHLKEEQQVLKPFLLGRDITPYAYKRINKLLILFEKGYTKKHCSFEDAENWFSQTFPNVSEHLMPFKDNAIRRTDKGDYWWELRACDYYGEFEKPKIMYQVMQIKPCFIYDEQGAYCNNSMWIIPKDDKVLLAILNSKMGWWLISKYCSAIQNGYQLIWKYFGQVPIATATDNQRVKIEAIVNEIIDLKKQDADTTILEKQIDQLVYELYGLTDEEIAIVEGKA